MGVAACWLELHRVSIEGRPFAVTKERHEKWCFEAKWGFRSLVLLARGFLWLSAYLSTESSLYPLFVPQMIPQRQRLIAED